MPRKTVVTWGPLIDRFIMEKDIAGLKRRTLDSYRWTLEQAVDYWGHDSDPLSMQKDDIMDVLGRWRRDKCKASTIANRISVFHTFFRWLSQKYKVYDPARDIERPKKDTPSLRWLSAGEVEDLLLAAAGSNERDQLVVWILAMTGVRRSELRDIAWRDVDTESCSIRIVLGKGGKGRTVEPPPVLCTFLADVRARLQEAGEYNAGDYVCPRARLEHLATGDQFQYERGKQMAVTQANKILVRLAREVGIADPTFVGPHVLRRSFATIFLEATDGKLYHLQEALGHSRIDTTEKYLAPLKRAQVRESVRKIDWFHSEGT